MSLLCYTSQECQEREVSASEWELSFITKILTRCADIIMSTYKPHVKNVTAEDVANSLYYVHFELLSESVLMPPAPIRGTDSPRSSLESGRSGNHIPRKPLPPSAKALPTAQKAVSDLGPPPPVRWTQRPVSRDVDDALRLDGESRSLFELRPELPPRSGHQLQSPVTPPTARKPLGPRSMTDSRPWDQEKVLPPVPGSDPLLPPSPRGLTPRAELQPLSASPVRDPSRSPSPVKRGNHEPYVPFSLTLIRRDPSSGHQWNVGRVSSYQLEAPEEEAGERPAYFPKSEVIPLRHPPISVHLETSGYAKFRGMPSRLSLDGHHVGSSTSLPRSFPGGAGERSPEDASPPPHKTDGGFSRQVFMAYRPSLVSNLKEKFRRSDSNEAARPKIGHSRQDSGLSTGSAGSSGSGGDGGSSAPVITRPGPGVKPRGYMFTSPWDGRCEFRTGNAGRSVKCRHVLQNSSGSSNPLVPSSQGRHGTAWSGSAPVSELRFNLPSSELFKPKGEGGSTAHQLHGHFSKLLKFDHHRDHREQDSEEYEDEPASPFELPLGREKAGGGNRGKRAKMGKLIVHHEGIKMLDLVVAANVGVWWGAWERSF
jgi:hypothetical protein